MRTQMPNIIHVIVAFTDWVDYHEYDEEKQ